MVLYGPQVYPYSGWVFVRAAQEWREQKGTPPPPTPPLPKIWYTYPTTMKLGTAIHELKKIQKIYESRDTHREFYWHHHFFTWNLQILLCQELQIWAAFSYIISNYLNFYWFFKIVLINMVTILMMSPKVPTPGLF